MRPTARALAIALALAVSSETTPVEALDAKRLPTQHIADRWAENEGLPQNSVRAITQSPDGFLWLGTEEGLVSFDGARFRVFDRSNTTGRTANDVLGIAIDAAGTLVLLGGRDGLCTFEGSTFSCAPLPDGAIATALRRVGDELWVSSSRGVFARRRDGTLTRAPVPADLLVRDVWRDPDGTIGFVAKEKGIVVMARGQTTTRDLGELASDDVSFVTRTRDGTQWVGARTGAYVMTASGLVRVAGAPERPVLFVADDADGNVFISFFNDGVYMLRGEALVRMALRDAQPAERIDAFFEDVDRNVWFGSRLSGLHRLRDGPFVPWGVPEGVTHGYVRSLMATRTGAMLVGTGGGGLFMIDGGHVTPIGVREGLASLQIESLAEGRGGTILVGTREGLFRLTSLVPPRAIRVEEAPGPLTSCALEEQEELWVGTRKGLVATRHGRTYTQADGLPGDTISTLYRARDGTLWIGTTSGLARMRGEHIEAAFPEAFGGVMVTSFLEQGDGSLLVATSNAGLFIVREGRTVRLDRRAGLFDDTVYSLLDGGDGNLWMSCNRGVYAVRLDAVDAFFSGRAENVESRAFGRSHGMRSRECNEGAAASARDSSGRLWFATMLGAVSVAPHTVGVSPPPRRPVIESVRVKGGLVSFALGIDLPHDNRSFDVTFAAPALVDPAAMRIEVRLVGARNDWQPTSSNGASFAALDPGSYVLEVRTRNDAGAASPPASLVVRVPPRATETLAVRVLLALGALSVVVLAARMRLRLLERERRKLASTVDERTRELASRNEELAAALGDLKRAETDLVRAERMASVATLVRGIAHELNNPLSFVAGNVAPLRRYAEFLLRSVHEMSEQGKRLEDLRLGRNKDLAYVERDLVRLLDDMEEGTKRARLIVGDLQSLTTGPSRTVEPVDLGKVVEQSVRLLAGSKPPGVTITIHADRCEPILARAGEIEQVAVNLIDNAIRAVGERGTIEVRLRAEGATRILTVRDDGPGMSDEVRARALEPFFTTRPAGEGSGLGLAIVARIAEHHEGSVSIDSAPGTGTAVTVRMRGTT